jgi:hypothetical protein
MDYRRFQPFRISHPKLNLILMRRPLGRAALAVSAPFSLAVARLHCPARLALAHLPPGSAAGQAGSPALQCVAPLACPALRGNCLQDRRARTSALRASVACAAYPFGSSALRLRSNWRARTSALRASASCVRQFGFAFGQTPAHLVCNGCSPVPPETRKVSGSAP